MLVVLGGICGYWGYWWLWWHSGGDGVGGGKVLWRSKCDDGGDGFVRVGILLM